MIAQCNACKAWVYYDSNSDLLDGHKCPKRMAPPVELASRRRPGQGGPVGDEAWTAYDLERASLDASEPADDEAPANVDFRLGRCPLCGSRQFKSKWDERDPLICMSCGSILGTGRPA